MQTVPILILFFNWNQKLIKEEELLRTLKYNKFKNIYLM